jgi:hypothetical protein
MTDHPRPCRRKTLGAALGFFHRPRRFGRAAGAARRVCGLVFGKRLRRMRAALVDGMRLARLGRHAGKMRRGQNHARRRRLAARTIQRQVAFGHWPQVGEGTAGVAKIFIDWHLFPARSISSHVLRRMRGGETVPSRIHRAGRAALCLEQDPFETLEPSFSDHAHSLSGESGIWMSPLICLIGPADDGMTSKSKISVGSHSVAQALGTSTTPEMWPWQGAVPRIE